MITARPVAPLDFPRGDGRCEDSLCRTRWNVQSGVATGITHRDTGTLPRSFNIPTARQARLFNQPERPSTECSGPRIPYTELLLRTSRTPVLSSLARSGTGWRRAQNGCTLHSARHVKPHAGSGAAPTTLPFKIEPIW